MTLSEALAERIEELLHEKQITQYRLSQISGVSQSTISDIRLKKNKSVNIRIIFELVDGLGMGLADFFDSPIFEKGRIED